MTFAHFLGPAGSTIVAIGLLLFAYSTILGWSYYGEKCFTYLLNEKYAIVYRIIFVIAVFSERSLKMTSSGRLPIC